MGLEQKLIELGYKKTYIDYVGFVYEKAVSNLVVIDIQTNKKCTKIIDFKVDGHRFIKKQYQLDEDQKAFDEMEKDLEVLRNVESER